MSNRKSIAIGLGVVAVAAAAGGVALLSARRRKVAEPQVPTCVEAYNASLAAYLEAARNGKLNADLIARLVADLDVVGEASDNGDISIELSPEQSETLIGIVADYTRNLADVNHLELGDL